MLSKVAEFVRSSAIKDMGLMERARYVPFVFDRSDDVPNTLFRKKAVKAFVPPLLLVTDLVMVFFEPIRKEDPAVVVYIDPSSNSVRGYLVGPADKSYKNKPMDDK